MSQPYYPNNYSQQYYHPGYDTTQPAQIQSQTYTNDYVRYESDVAPSAQPASDSSDLYSQVDYATTNNSSNLGQTFTYSQVDYATDNAANNFSSYNPAPEHVGSRYPDSVNQIPHQPQVVPGRNWDHPVQYAEVPVVHPGDLHDQRRNSCASGTDGNVWYSQENAGHYSQPAYEQTQHANHQAPTFRQQQDPMNLGMYSPTQYSQTRHIAHDAAFDAVDHSKVEVPYGSLPIHDGAHCEQQSSNTAYQTFDNSSVGYHSAQSSPTFTQAHYSSNDSSPPASPIEEHSDQSDQDLFAQQRRAAGYQHVLQANQELKYQLSGQFQQFEANQQRQDGYTSSQEYARHHPYQRPTHHRQSPSSEHSRLMTAPIVPSQAHERIPPIVQASPKAQGKKVVVSKKPALACKFCRKRKIACGAPPPTNLDRTCNQCARRGLECCYPTESRRGIRKTPKEPVPEEPTVHKFVPSDGSAHEGGVGPVRRGRKRASN